MHRPESQTQERCVCGYFALEGKTVLCPHMELARGSAFFGLGLLLLLTFIPFVSFAQGDGNRPPIVKPIHANLVAPVTIYTVEATDPDGDQLTYRWDGDVACGLFHDSVVESATWAHPNEIPPFGCPHEDGTSHDGSIMVHVSDGKDSVLCSYDGSESGDGAPCLTNAPVYYPEIFADWEDFFYEYCYYFLIPLLALILYGGWWFYNNGLFVDRKEEDDPCAKQRRDEAAARAAYESARAKFDAIDSAKKSASDARLNAQNARNAADAAARAAGGRWSAHGSTDWEGEHIEVHKEGWQNKELGAKADAAASAANEAADAAKKAKKDYDAAGGDNTWQSAKSAMEAAKAAWEAAAAALKVCIGGIGVPKPETPPTPPPPTGGNSGPTTNGGGSDGGQSGQGGTTPPTTGGGTKPPEKKHDDPPRRVCIDGEKRNERNESIDVSILDLPSVVLKQDRIYSDAGNEAMKFVDYLQTIKDVFMMGKQMKGGADAYLDKSLSGAADAVEFPDFLEWYDKGIDNLTKSMHELYTIMQDKQRLGDYWLEYRIKKLTLTCTRWEQCANNRWVSRCTLTVEDNGFETHRTNPEQVFEAKEVQRAISRLFTMLRNRYNGDKTRMKQFTTSCQ